MTPNFWTVVYNFTFVTISYAVKRYVMKTSEARLLCVRCATRSVDTGSSTRHVVPPGWVTVLLIHQHNVPLFKHSLTFNNHYSNVLLFQQSHLFDNVGTVFFAIFMGIWGEQSLVRQRSIAKQRHPVVRQWKRLNCTVIAQPFLWLVTAGISII